ncbi:hypothetical protein PLAN_30443 [Planktothrix rubescens CCAP 1459/22]|uniref:Uncharacterized protein n=1 Tax=Planktothrix rubescens CCAP 1459/22 TaxID=329571 RepID=A0A6J7ZLR3_PLARU|nr:hypothetical protein PLAN_30443 [Planktothrix rubescens NIVA-CYA 18]
MHCASYFLGETGYIIKTVFDLFLPSYFKLINLTKHLTMEIEIKNIQPLGLYNYAEILFNLLGLNSPRCIST